MKKSTFWVPITILFLCWMVPVLLMDCSKNPVTTTENTTDTVYVLIDNYFTPNEYYTLTAQHIDGIDTIGVLWFKEFIETDGDTLLEFVSDPAENLYHYSVFRVGRVD